MDSEQNIEQDYLENWNSEKVEYEISERGGLSLVALGAYRLVEGNSEAVETAYRGIEVALEPNEAQGLISSAQILARSRIFGGSTTLVKTILDEEAKY